MKNKRTGVTLLELVVALAILSLVVVPIYNLFTTSTRINAYSRKMTMATFTAQLRMEELVGLDKDALKSENKTLEDYNGFKVTSSIPDTDYRPEGSTDSYPELREATVTVLDTDDSELYILTNVLYVGTD